MGFPYNARVYVVEYELGNGQKMHFVPVGWAAIYMCRYLRSDRIFYLAMIDRLTVVLLVHISIRGASCDGIQMTEFDI